MPVRKTAASPLVFAATFALGSTLLLNPAWAAGGRHSTSGTQSHELRSPTRVISHGRVISRQSHGGGISCVPFARSDSGIHLTGNAWQWWGKADGVYARGHVPEAGSILAFRSNPRMRLGHVAVVSRVINAREIEIDHANWGPGNHMRGPVTRSVPVVDVSESNDWTAVRVGLGESDEFGAVYPTYGFIYDRPDNGVIVAAAGVPAPALDLSPPRRDLRPAAERQWRTYEEVAEAPERPVRRRR